MRKTLLFPALFIIAVLPPLLAHTAEPEDGAEKRDPVLIYREAGATAEQEAKIRQFAQEYDKEARVRVERLRNLSRQMKELSYEPEIDEKKVLTMQDEINQLQNALSTDRIKMMLKIRGSLNTEQRTKLVELLKEREQNQSNKTSNEALK
jgi:Spy/CpxP family protein refolding chaperone